MYDIYEIHDILAMVGKTGILMGGKGYRICICLVYAIEQA
jgi:hypothetical protein